MKNLIDIRYELQYYLTLEWRNFLYILFRKKQKVIPRVLSIEDSIKKIIEGNCSVSRFGDGEILLMENKSIGFQKSSKELSSRLKEVLLSENEKHLVCISDVFSDLFRYNRYARRYWRAHFYLYGSKWDETLCIDRTYGNTFISRPYLDFKTKKNSGIWFKLLKEIWRDRDVVFIEGEKSRLGVGNDLFDNACSIRRILCPAENAFERYDEILQQASQLKNNVLILIALGPTATILAYDLYHLGFQAIDIGHVDIEYEWFKMKAKKRVKIPDKYVNEVSDGNIITDIMDENYKRQIICHIQ